MRADLSAVDVATIVAGVVAALAPIAAVLAGLRGLYRRTLGSRAGLARRIRDLGCGVTDEYVRQLFGAPTFTRASEVVIEHVYLTPHALIQTISS
jgi:hypothetical protein